MRGFNRVALILSSAAILAAEPLRLAAQIVAPDTQPATAPSTQAAPTTQPTTQSSFVAGVPTVLNPPDGRHRPPTTQIAFNFKDASIDAILDYLSQTAGYIVIKSAQVSGRVSVESKEPVTPDEAVVLLQSVLRTSNFTIIQMGRVLKVMTFADAKKGNVPVMQGEDPAMVPLTDQVVTWVIPIKSVDAIKLKQDLQPLIGPDADLTANGGSNSIIMTDTSANIHRVVQIVANLDTKTANESTILIQKMQYADAAAAAKIITDLFKPDTTNQNQGGALTPGNIFRLGGFGGGGGGGGRGGGGGGFGGPGGGFGGGGLGGGGGGGGRGAAAEEQGNLGKVMASSDERTNTVVVTGPPDTLAVIKDILEKLDQPAAQQKFFIYNVKNGTAVDIASTINSMFTGTSSSSSSSGNNTANRLSSSGSSGFGSSGGGGGSSGGSSGFSGSTINRTPVTGSGTGGSGGGLAALTKTGGSGAASPLADLIGQVYVVADQDTNSLLIATASRYEVQIRDVLARLDRPVPQVLIKVLIAEVTHDNSLDVGADWSILNLNSRPGGQAGLTLGSNLGNAAAGTSAGGLTVSLVETNLTATLHALATAGKVDVLSRPYILTSDNQPAEIVIGSEVPIITNSQLTDTGQQINTVQYRDIGIILDVTPHINPDGLVICDVSPEVSATTDQSTPIASNVSAPVFSVRSANTRVGIKDGTTIVIGGLMQDQKTSTVSKIPILGDLPWLGPVFSRTQVSKTKTELLFFITPHVAQAPEQLQGMSEDEMKGTKLTPRAVRPGIYGEQMRGMQLGGSTTQPVPLISPAGAGPNQTQPSVNPTAPLAP
jgi:general secretion pathway protein D